MEIKFSLKICTCITHEQPLKRDENHLATHRNRIIQMHKLGLNVQHYVAITANSLS